MSDELKEAIKELLNDINIMRHGRKDHWFDGFPFFNIGTIQPDGMMFASVEWPNLSYMARKVEKLLNEVK